MAGADRMYDALFRQVGVIRAQSFADLLDVPAALATGRAMRGRRVAILTSTGGAGTLVSDDLGVAGFDTPAPDDTTAAALRALQTGSEAVLDRNPIDVTLAGLRPDLLRGAIRALLASPGYDALVIIVGSSSLAMPELLAGAIQECLPGSDKPVLAYVSPHAPEVAALLTRSGVPAFAAAESCTAALRAMATVDRFAAATQDAGTVPPVAIDGLPSGSLDEVQAKQLFARFGVPCAPERVVTTPAEAEAATKALGGVRRGSPGGCASGSLSRAADGERRHRVHPRPAPGCPGNRGHAGHGRGDRRAVQGHHDAAGAGTRCLGPGRGPGNGAGAQDLAAA
jgi:acyl-CoA synthetase (NDP forming)